MGDTSRLDLGDSSPETSLMHAADTEVQPDFSGWASKYGLRCSDGRTILPGSFEHQDSARVPQVSHGIIREVSLVLAGANPGALIDNIMVAHADGENEIHVDEAVIYTGLELEHGEMSSEEETQEDEETAEHAATESEEDDPSIEEVYEQMSDDEKAVVHYMVGAALESAATSSNETDTETDTSASEEVVTHEDKDQNNMGLNVFEQDRENGGSEIRHTISHDDMQGIAANAVK